MARKAILLILFFALFAADTAYFGARCAAGVFWLRGERRMFNNDLKRAWRFFELATTCRGNSARIETEMAELLLMGLDELAAGVHAKLPLDPDASLNEAFALLGRRISAEPFNAYSWSQVSDLYIHAAVRRRRAETLDLSSLSDNPMENWLPEERLGLAAQEIAARLEPNNYLYHSLLAQLYMDLGSPESAAPHCRRAVAAAPDLRVHPYLSHADLPEVILDAALLGFEDASARPSMIPSGFALGEAGRMLSEHGDDRRAVSMLQRAVETGPDSPDLEMQLADANYRLRNYETSIVHADRAAQMTPLGPWPHYVGGLSYLALGKLEPAIEAFRRARELGPQEMRFFRMLGETLESAGHVKEAERQFVAAANLNPLASDAWASLLAFYVRQNNREAATAVCSKLAALRPRDDTYSQQCAAIGSPR